MARPFGKHPGTGRRFIVLSPARLADASPYASGGDKYVLLLVQDGAPSAFTVEVARKWLDAGASYVCAWGQNAADLEECFDYAAFLPELGNPLPFTLMTTAHAGEPLAEALRFALWDSAPPEDLKAQLELVVVQPESRALADQALNWLQSNNHNGADEGDA